MQLFRHPNLLPLLQHAVLPLQSDSGLAYIIYMLTPAYQVILEPALHALALCAVNVAALPCTGCASLVVSCCLVA